MADGASSGPWVVWLAVSAALSCGQRAEPATSTGTSAAVVEQPAAAETTATNAASPPNPSDSQPPPGNLCAANAVEAVRSISPTHCEVPRSVLFDDKDCLLAQPRLTPYAVNGEVVGFRHDSIPSRSVYAACGIRSGDVWTKLNGEPLNSPEQVLRIYPSLRGSDQLEIEILRGAKTLEVQIELR